jgi:hypothetical protein
MQEESWFFEWHQPVEFHQRHNAVGRGIQDADHRRQSYKWYREAWVLKLFAIATDASDLRLIKDDPPDGEVRLAGKIIPTEIVEVFEEGRQPDKEFRQGPRKHLSTLSQWDNELTFIKTSLDNRINKKERNNYPNDTVLIVYLNMGGETRLPHEDTHGVIRAACDRPTLKFKAVCVLWRHWLFGPSHFYQRRQGQN